MYDYLFKILLVGPSGTGKSCLLHRFVHSSFRVLTSQTIGVEFASKILKIGTGSRRKRVKLQLWDTAGQERFRSVSRSYYRGAAGALLVYDVARWETFDAADTFLEDLRNLGSPEVVVIMVGNKCDLEAEGRASMSKGAGGANGTTAAAGSNGSAMPAEGLEPGRTTSPKPIPTGRMLGSQTSTTNAAREVPRELAARWAGMHAIPLATETSALTGEGVDEVFEKLAKMILTKIELGEIDPDDPRCGVQYGDAPVGGRGYESVKARRRGRGWSEVFKGGGRCCS